MKRTYINPEMQVVKVQFSTRLLSGSANGTDVKSGNASAGYETLGREFGFDDAE